LPWKLPKLAYVETLDEEEQVLAREPITHQDGRIVVTCEPGVFAYRLVRGSR
jgi:hypothetical protein